MARGKVNILGISKLKWTGGRGRGHVRARGVAKGGAGAATGSRGAVGGGLGLPRSLEWGTPPGGDPLQGGRVVWEG